MSLLTAHRILISSAIVFFAGYAGWETWRFAGSGEFLALGRAAFGVAVAVAFGLYYRTIGR
jgi:hypothetical protein